MSDTWSGNLGNQIPTGNAVRDFGGGSWTIPTELNKRAFTKANWATYTTIATGNSPVGALPSNQCPTQDQILGTL
jgi:hypothetical protein